MRNLLEFPLTPQEAVDAIDQSIEKYKGQVGGLEPYALHVVKSFIFANKELFDNYINSEKIHK